jgi:sugar phosphate isomerase/epimerase
MILCSSAAQAGETFENAMKAFGDAGLRDIDLIAINTWAHINPAVLAADYENTAARMESVLQKNGITLRAMNIGLSCQMHDRRPESVRRNLSELDALCRLMNRFNINAASLQPLQKDDARAPRDVLDDCIVSLGEYYTRAKQRGISLGLELHVNSPFESMDAVRYLFEKIPGAGVVYDPSHFIMQGHKPEDCEFIFPNIVQVHLRDAALNEMQTQLGKGAADFGRIVGKLKAAGYGGHYTVEYIQNDGWDAIAESLKLRDLLAEII